MQDKFTATWVSHSSISDFLKCPRAYYLNNVYKNPKTGRKISLISPAMTLGSAVHNILESLSVLPAADRFKASLVDKFEIEWQRYTGEIGGFKNPGQETEYKNRGLEMLRHVKENPGPLLKKTVKINEKLPYYFLSDEDNIILCGKIDWLEYNEEDDSVSVLDFKTGKNGENPDSLQLPIYLLLVNHCQKRKVKKAYYWYLDKDDGIVEQILPTAEEAENKVLNIAREIKQARADQNFICKTNGCFACRDLEKIITNEAKFLGVGEYNREIYSIND